MANTGGQNNLRQLVTELQKVHTSGDYDRAVKTAAKIIRSFPKENYAYKCKLVGLIQMGKLDEAAAFIQETPVAKIGNVAFENAYILYRKNETEKALEMLQKADQSDPGVIELKAQLFFRMERYQEAKELLIQLLKSDSDDNDFLRRANLITVEALLEASGVSSEPQGDLDGFEQMYNVACHLIEKEEYEKALKLLDKAVVLCKKTMTENGDPEEDIDEELAIIQVQKGFVLQKLGRNDEALKIYSAVYDKNPSDTNAKATLLNNLPTTRRDVIVKDARMKIKAAAQLDKTKLSKRQQRVLLFNTALMNLLSNQREPCRKTLAELESRFGKLNEAILVETALFVRQKDVQSALATLNKAADTSEAQLLKAQILINAGQVDEGIQVLQKLPGQLKYALAIVSLIVSLRQAQNNEQAVLKTIEEAESYWSKQKDTKTYHSLLIKGAHVLSLYGKHDKAIQFLEKVYAVDPENPIVICRLIKAYGIVGNPKAEKLMEKLKPSGSEASVNADELEENDWVIYGQKYKKKEGTKKDEIEDTEIVTGKLRKRKRKRKVILPKNYDPSIPPDPERWLPKSERTAFKKKLNKKFKDKDIGRGTQGAANDAIAEKMDYSHDSPGQPHVSPAVSSPKPAEGPRQKGPAGKAKKKQNKKRF